MSDISNLPIKYRIMIYDEITSTNDEAKICAMKGEQYCPDWTLIWAKSQTAGRGRRGRVWESLDGNLFASIILRPKLPAQEALQISYIASIAVHETTVKHCSSGDSVLCKWPNDILLNNKKISGILLESSGIENGLLDWLVIGLGVNICKAPNNTSYPTTSFHNEGILNITREDFLLSFSRSFLKWHNIWSTDGFAYIRDIWLKRAKGINSQIRILTNNRIISGIFVGINNEGSLLLKNDALSHKYHVVSAGDIYFS